MVGLKKYSEAIFLLDMKFRRKFLLWITKRLTARNLSAESATGGVL